MIFIDHFLGRNSFLFRLQCNGYPMFIAAADKRYILALQPLITRINICRNVNARQMPDVDGAIGIRKGGSNSISFCRGGGCT